MGSAVDELQVPIQDDQIEYGVFSSFASTNPWVLYEANVVCFKDENDVILKNSSGEKVIHLREWFNLSQNQRLSLERQGYTREDWESLPWTGHQCYLMTRAWELGRLRAYYMSKNDADGFDQAGRILGEARNSKLDWLRGIPKPDGWGERNTLYPNPSDLPEEFKEYDRNRQI